MERPSRRRSADEAFACTAPNSHKQEFSIDHHQNKCRRIECADCTLEFPISSSPIHVPQPVSKLRRSAQDAFGGEQDIHIKRQYNGDVHRDKRRRISETESESPNASNALSIPPVQTTPSSTLSQVYPETNNGASDSIQFVNNQMININEDRSHDLPDNNSSAFIDPSLFSSQVSPMTFMDGASIGPNLVEISTIAEHALNNITQSQPPEDSFSDRADHLLYQPPGDETSTFIDSFLLSAEFNNTTPIQGVNTEPSQPSGAFVAQAEHILDDIRSGKILSQYPDPEEYSFTNAVENFEVQSPPLPQQFPNIYGGYNTGDDHGASAHPAAYTGNDYGIAGYPNADTGNATAYPDLDTLKGYGSVGYEPAVPLAAGRHTPTTEHAPNPYIPPVQKCLSAYKGFNSNHNYMPTTLVHPYARPSKRAPYTPKQYPRVYPELYRADVSTRSKRRMPISGIQYVHTYTDLTEAEERLETDQRLKKYRCSDSSKLRHCITRIEDFRYYHGITS